MHFLIAQYSPSSSCVISRRYSYSSQHFFSTSTIFGGFHPKKSTKSATT